jgi:hypothetical protein
MRRVFALAALCSAALATAGPVAARSDVSTTARLADQFQLTGRITAARHVRGERVGATVLRMWTFTPLCAAGPCKRIRLSRQRAAGVDALVLNLRRADYYVGRGRFFAPVRCGGRRYARGESVPFTVTVRITGAVLSAGTAVATRIHATYTNRRRFNRTPCVVVPGHDAAVYRGTLAPPAT